MAALLNVNGLTVRFGAHGGAVHAVDGVNFHIKRGETYGLIGESGSGKSATCLAILGLLPPPARVSGSIVLDGRELLGAGEGGWRNLRGQRIGYIPQDPMASLNPVRSIGWQMTQLLRIHQGLSSSAARAEAVALLRRVGITAPEERLSAFPHQLSGGMCQRVLIAMALAGRPDLLIADEATTALDVTVQAQVLSLLMELQNEMGMAILLVTHDFGVVAETCDRVGVMRSGRLIEEGTVSSLFSSPHHEYTRRLRDAALPQAAASGRKVIQGRVRSLLEVRDLVCQYKQPGRTVFSPRRTLRAVDKVSLTIAPGETLGLVGESGCGKSTLGRAVLGIIKPSEGSVQFEGSEIRENSTRWRSLRSNMQLIYQDSLSALDPRMAVADQIVEPLTIRGISASERSVRLATIAEQVGLSTDLLSRRPHALSGGQRQRAVIARALILQPKLVVCDEPVASLDPTLRVQIISLLGELRERLALSYLIISHDLDIIRRLCDRVAVMYLGRIVEIGPASQVLNSPSHPYTTSLLNAAPIADPAARRLRPPLKGEPSSSLDVGRGCAFAPRCQQVSAECRVERPELFSVNGNQFAACFAPSREEGAA